MKILYTTKEAFEKARKFFNDCHYEWTYENKDNNNYLITIFF